MTAAESGASATSTRDRILEVAQALFIEPGYPATSLQDIADRIGVTKAAVYYHFPAKEDILSALLVDILAETDHLLDRLDDYRDMTLADWRDKVILPFMDVMLSGARGPFLVLERNPASTEILRHREGFEGAHRYHRQIAKIAADETMPLAERMRILAALSVVIRLLGFPFAFHQTPTDELLAEMRRIVDDLLSPDDDAPQRKRKLWGR